MIDSLTLQIPFAPSWVDSNGCELEKIAPDPFTRDLVCSVNPQYLPNIVGAKDISYTREGIKVEELYCPWESLKSSHAGMALKVFFAGNGACKWPYVEIKCSPAKLVQGHNIYGFDDLRFAATNMLNILNNVYPEFLAGYEVLEDRGALLDIEKTRVSSIDITYSCLIESEKERFAFIDFIRSISKGHTKNNSNSYDSTVYFGSKSSRLKKIKVYLKYLEVLADNKQRQKQSKSLIPEQLVKLSEKLVRIEATAKKEWFERRGINTNLFKMIDKFEQSENFYWAVFSEITKDLFSALDGQEIKIMNDDKVYAAIDKIHGETRGKTARLFGFYKALKAVGFEEYKRQMPDSTFRRNISELEMCGFSRAHLCALDRPVIIQLPTIIKIKECHEPSPADYDYKKFRIA